MLGLRDDATITEAATGQSELVRRGSRSTAKLESMSGKSTATATDYTRCPCQG
jgi:hypothetical protein